MLLRHTLPSTCAAFLLALGIHSAAHAATGHTQNGSGACSPALPAYEGNIRKRPLAMQNEGTGTAFVSCSLVAGLQTGGNGRPTTFIYVGVVNNTAEPLDLTCTLVDGVANSITPRYMPKSVTIPGGGWREFYWSATDNGGYGFIFSPSVSCALPVGTGISYTAAYAPD